MQDPRTDFEMLSLKQKTDPDSALNMAHIDSGETQELAIHTR